MGDDSGECRAALENEVVEDLHDALPVGHHARQVRRQVDANGVPPAAAQEGAAGLVHQARHLRGLGSDRERAGLDAPRVQQVADQAPHVVGLLVDDPEELQHLGRVERLRGVQHGGGRALDGGQRRPQLVAHHAQELGPQPLELLQRRQVLHRDHHRLDLAVRGRDRRDVDQRRDAPTVGDREHDLLGAHRLAVAQVLRQRELVQGDGRPASSLERDYVQQLLCGAAGRAQAFGDAPRLAVERLGAAGPGIEDHNAHRRRFDQGLQVGPRPAHVPVGAGVGDRRSRLRREQNQDLLVLARELAPALLGAQEEEPHAGAPMMHRRAQEGRRPPRGLRGMAERLDVGRQVGQSQHARQVPEVLEEAHPGGPADHPLVFLGSEPGKDGFLDLPRVVDCRDHAVAGTGQRAGAVDDLAQDGGDLEACVDAQDSRAQIRAAVPQRLVLALQLVVAPQRLAPPHRTGANDSKAAPELVDGHEQVTIKSS